MLLVALSAGAKAVANEPPTIVTERPSFSSTPLALPRAAVQVEAGYQYARNRGTAESIDRTLPFALLRTGFTDALELQVGWAGWSRLDAGSRNISGANDPTVGVKWQLTGTDEALTLALLAGTSLPLGDSELSGGEAEPVASALWSYSGTLEWFGAVQVRHSGDETSYGNAVGLSFTLAPRTSTFIEYFGSYGQRSGPEHSVNGGLAYLLRSNLQLDVYAGAGLNDRATDLFVGTGIGYRFR